MTTWSLIPLVTCIAYIVLFILTLPSIRRRPNKVFSYYLVVAAFWSFTSFMLHLEASPQQTIFWNKILIIAMIWSLITYYQFILAYSSKPDGKSLYLGYTFLVVLAILSLSGRIVQYSYVADGMLHHNIGISVYFIGAIAASFIGGVLYLLVRKFRSSTDPVDRNRTVYLIAGWSNVVVFTYTNLVPILSNLPLDHIGGLINALIISYAISRLHLLDIKFVVRRGVAYLIVVISLIGVYAAVILEWHWVYSDQPVYVLLFIAGGLAILLVLGARPLWRAIQERIDRFVYRETYSYRQVLLKFSTQMSSIINLNELADKMLPTINKALRITQAKLLFPNSMNGGEFSIQFAYPDLNGKSDGELKIAADNPIIDWLSKHATPLALKDIDNIPQLKGLWQTEKEKLLSSKLELLCPIKSRNKLVGIIALGKKQSSRLYSQEDIAMLISLANQAGIIIENAQLYSNAIERANTDELTRLYNHRYFHERIEQEIGRSSRFGAVFSLIMLDIDHFKTYNDTYGHLAGDKVLQMVGECIDGSIRSIDMGFRYGGEEFAVILPETRINDAYKVAERIRKTVETKASPESMPVTVSLGIASWPIDGMVKEEIISRSDAALYEAKRTGRNKTCTSSEVLKPATFPKKLEAKTPDVIYALAATVDAKDHYTYGHSKKVSDSAVALATAITLPADRIASIRAAGLLHDVGKIGIPDSILNKRGPLTAEEWESVQAHPRIGVEILRHVPDLAACLPIILHHHERYDGTGYPAGLKGNDIPIEARILAIADAYDAMTSLRPYRKQLSAQEALDELQRHSGTQFDPELVEAFRKLVKRTTSVATLQSGW